MAESHESDAELGRIEALRARLETSRESVTARIAALEKPSRRLMALRLTSFTVAVFCFFATVLTAREAWTLYGVLPALALFSLLVVVHRPLRRRLNDRRRLLGIIEAKLARVGRERRSGFEPLPLPPPDPLGGDALPEGSTRSVEHHVLDDLGLLGGATPVLGLVDTCSSRLGRLTLASWIAHPTRDAARIRERQEASARLVAEVDLRHAIERLLAPLGDVPGDADLAFLRSGDLDLPLPRSPWLLPLAVAVPLVLIVLAFAFASTIAFFAGLGAAVLVNVYLRTALARVPELRGALLQQAAVVRAAADVAELLRPLAGSTAGIDAARREIEAVTLDPRHRRRGLELRLAALRLYRLGLLYVVFAFFTLWDLWFLGPLLAHQRARRSELKALHRALGRIDAMRAWATLVEEQSAWRWPEIVAADAPRLELVGARHPLLPARTAVGNDLVIGDAQRVLVITGSNMSGKSTWLKTCGLAVLLGQAGGPVRAERARMTPMAVASDINVRDSLDDGRSYFAVEVDRIGAMLELVGADPFALLLLDEMFRGTNTHEKIAAGFEVARWIASSGCLAIIATHDHEITLLAGEAPELGVRNAHFRDDVADDRMVFGYRLEPGPALGSNAIRVLAARGFPPELVERALERSKRHD